MQKRLLIARCCSFVVASGLTVRLAAQDEFGPLPQWIESIQVFHGQAFERAGPNNSEPEIISLDFQDGDSQAILRSFTTGGVRPLADISGHVSSSQQNPIGLSVRASIRYSFMLDALDPQAPPRQIPLLYATRGHVSFDGIWGGVELDAKVELDGRQIAQAVVNGIEDKTSDLQEFDHPASTLGFDSPGTVHTFELTASAEAGGWLEFQALVDPLVYIDPAFQFKDAYRIVYNSPEITQPTMNLANAGAMWTAPGNGGPDGVLEVSGLTIADGAKLDLNNNSAIINYTANSPAQTIRQYLFSGRGGPGFGATWMGPGISSSAAATTNASAPESRSIAYADNAAMPLGPLSTFKGHSVDNTSVLIAFTRTGDANLDGIVNDDDVTIVGTFYAPGVSKPEWAKGDFDYNGFVDDDDVTLLGVFYNPSATPIPSPAAVAAVAAVGAANVSAVPEPGTLALVISIAAVTGLALARRHWKRQKRRPYRL